MSRLAWREYLCAVALIGCHSAPPPSAAHHAAARVVALGEPISRDGVVYEAQLLVEQDSAGPILRVLVTVANRTNTQVIIESAVSPCSNRLHARATDRGVTHAWDSWARVELDEGSLNGGAICVGTGYGARLSPGVVAEFLPGSVVARVRDVLGDSLSRGVYAISVSFPSATSGQLQRPGPPVDVLAGRVELTP